MNIGFITGYISSWLRQRRVSMGVCSFFAMCGIWAGVKTTGGLASCEQFVVFAESLGFAGIFFGFLAMRAVQVGIIVLCARSKVTCALCFAVVIVASVVEGIFLGCTLAASENMILQGTTVLFCIFPKYLFYTVGLYYVFSATIAGNLYSEVTGIKYLAIADIVLALISSALMA